MFITQYPNAVSCTHASVIDLQKTIPKRIQVGAFLGRRYSWLSREAGYLLKIPRVSGSLKSDAGSKEARERAEEEHRNLLLLSSLSPSVVRPALYAPSYACIALPYIEGKDLADRLREPTSDSERRSLLTDAISILAAIHRNSLSATVTDIPAKDYFSDAAFPLRPGGRIRRTIIVRGFEVRNLRIGDDGTMHFFDPHQVELGVPEEDVTRFVLSLLMLNWPRDPLASVWDLFSFSDLRTAYERVSGLALNEELLRYTFRWNVNLRRAGAAQSARRLSLWKMALGHLYTSLFFANVTTWARKHGF